MGLEVIMWLRRQLAGPTILKQKARSHFVTVNSATVEKYALSVSFERMPNHGMDRSRASEVLMVP